MDTRLIVRPNIADLSFQLFDRPLHPELVESLACHRFAREDYRLAVHLTPAGHLLEWHRQGATITELLAHQDDDLPDSRQVFAHRLGGERSERFVGSGGLCYQVCFSVERQPERVFLRTNAELRRDAEKDGIIRVLRPKDRLSYPPLSFLDLQARLGSVLIHSYHTFPDEHAIVKVQTLVEFSA